MNSLLQSRLTEITSEADINNLRPGSVFYFKNSPMRVFEGMEREKYVFYWASVIGDDIELLKTRRGSLRQCGNMISHSRSGFDESSLLNLEDGEEYSRRHNDLVALGLMKAG
jgi:hypothetical protein